MVRRTKNCRTVPEYGLVTAQNTEWVDKLQPCYGPYELCSGTFCGSLGGNCKGREAAAAKAVFIVLRRQQTAKEGDGSGGVDNGVKDKLQKKVVVMMTGSGADIEKGGVDDKLQKQVVVMVVVVVVVEEEEKEEEEEEESDDANKKHKHTFTVYSFSKAIISTSWGKSKVLYIRTVSYEVYKSMK